ncbi:hypothetical protein AusDCA_2110 [Desulfitobacterium sp. AusDCA]
MKAIQAADIIVKPGGVIILCAECSEGISNMEVSSCCCWFGTGCSSTPSWE